MVPHDLGTWLITRPPATNQWITLSLCEHFQMRFFAPLANMIICLVWNLVAAVAPWTCLSLGGCSLRPERYAVAAVLIILYEYSSQGIYICITCIIMITSQIKQTISPTIARLESNNCERIMTSFKADPILTAQRPRTYVHACLQSFPSYAWRMIDGHGLIPFE